MEYIEDDEWEAVGTLVPRAFHLCIYKLKNPTSSESHKYRVRVLFERAVAEDIYCRSLSELLQLLSTVTPIAYVGVEDWKERTQGLHLSNSECNFSAEKERPVLGKCKPDSDSLQNHEL